MKKILLIISLIFISTSIVSAENDVQKEAADEKLTQQAGSEELYAFPQIAPEFTLTGGYRFVDVSGSKRVEEYEYLHDSLMLGGELRLFSFPHRFHLELDEKNRKDYFGDISYAYKDLVLFRGVNRTLFHNLENITLIDLNPATASPGVDVRDRDMDYGVRVGISNVFLRFKTPDFPLHLYMEGNFIEKTGSVQQRNLFGSGYFVDNMIRASQRRKIDWNTRNLTVGTNAHLGPVEIDLSRSEKRFDSGRQSMLLEPYTDAFVRGPGLFPHSLVPDLKGSTNTLKIHTSHTGRLVAAATLSRTDRENSFSGAKAEYLVGSGEVIWMPITRLTAFVKYRHRDIDFDNPDMVTITDLNDPSHFYTYDVRPSISSVSDKVTGGVRYRLSPGVTLRGEYSYEDIRRRNADLWHISEATHRNIVSLNTDIRVVRGLNLKLKYTHKEINNPAYNIDPDRSGEGKMSVTWVPLPRISTILSYSLLKEKRDDLRFVEPDGTTTEADNRRVTRDKIFSSITLMLLKDLSCTGSFYYMQNKTRQDIEYHDLSGIPFIDTDVPYGDISRNYSLHLNYVPVPNVALNGGISHTKSSGSFSPKELNLTEPVSVSSFSELKLRETAYYAAGEYQFKGGFSAGLRYSYRTLKDLLDNPNNDISNGTANIVLLTLSKKW
jgi:opacity protein-like surface antigen